MGKHQASPKLKNTMKDFYALIRVAAMLLPVGQSTAWNILQSLKNGGTEDKAGAEIVDPGAI